MKNSTCLTSGVFLVAAAFGLLEIAYAALTPDTNIFMHAALHLLQGDGLYERLLDINAPFHILLDVPIVALAMHLHMSPATILHGFTVLSCLLSLASLARALRIHGLPPQ